MEPDIYSFLATPDAWDIMRKLDILLRYVYALKSRPDLTYIHYRNALAVDILCFRPNHDRRITTRTLAYCVRREERG